MDMVWGVTLVACVPQRRGDAEVFDFQQGHSMLCPAKELGAIAPSKVLRISVGQIRR
jgi:hypothetical protein